MNVQPIEGITPSALWTTASVLLGLAGIAIIVFKIVEFRWKWVDSDKRRLEALESQQDDADEGFRVLCKATLALLNNVLHNGNGDEMEAAQKALQNYLIEK